MDYHTAYRELIVHNAARNRLIADIAVAEAARGPVMILVNWIEHVRALWDILPHTASAYVTGESTTEEMRQVLDALRAAELRVLLATDVFGEGVDVPAVSSVVIASGGKGHIKLLQRVGRGMRKHAQKDTLHVHDFIDDTHPILLKHSEARYKVYNSEGFCVRLGQ